MELRSHYESYQEAVKKDALEGFAEYAAKTPTREPALWPTVYDYLTHAVRSIKAAIQKGDESEYVKWIERHQETMILLFEHMVLDHTKPFATVDEKLVAVLNKGWRWYKFSDLVVHFTNHTWIPRYTEKFWTEPVPFCADEMEEVLDANPPFDTVEKILQLKKDELVLLFGVRPAGYTAMSLGDLNKNGHVNEWTWRLFH